MVAKLTSILTGLASTIAKPGTLLLPDGVRGSGQAIHQELSDILKMCQLVISAPDNHPTLELPAMKDLAVKLNHAKKIDQLLAQMASATPTSG